MAEPESLRVVTMRFVATIAFVIAAIVGSLSWLGQFLYQTRAEAAIVAQSLALLDQRSANLQVTLTSLVVDLKGDVKDLQAQVTALQLGMRALEAQIKKGPDIK